MGRVGGVILQVTVHVVAGYRKTLVGTGHFSCPLHKDLEIWGQSICKTVSSFQCTLHVIEESLTKPPGSQVSRF